jgi:MerR family transcriptional regulator, copper efflux regulator
MNRGILIGTLAARCGISRDAIRLYEARGLIRPQRGQQGAHGYRTYEESDVRRVTLIQQAQSLGFSLREIAELIDAWADHMLPTTRKRMILDEKIDAIDARIAAMHSLRSQLVDARAVITEDCSDHSAATTR